MCLSADPGFIQPLPLSGTPVYLEGIQFGNEDGTSDLNTASAGRDLFIYGTSVNLFSVAGFSVLRQYITPDSEPPELLTGHDTAAACFELGAPGTVAPLLPLFSFASLATSVHSEQGKDEAGCGSYQSPCKTITHCFETQKDKEKNIFVQAQDTFDFPASLGSHSLELSGTYYVCLFFF